MRETNRWQGKFALRARDRGHAEQIADGPLWGSSEAAVACGSQVAHGGSSGGGLQRKQANILADRLLRRCPF